MAQFLNHINLNGNELRNFLVQPLGAAPPDTTWKLGRKYFDTTDGREQIYNGSKWLRTAYMSDIVAINDIANGVDERLKAIEAYFDSAADADNTINKWNEIVAFLNATENTTLVGILDTYALKSRRVSAGTGLTGGGDLSADMTISLAEVSGLTAGTYKSVTVDKYGRVTGGTNPTTLVGYGITDAYTKAQVDGLLEGLDSVTVTPTLTSGEKIADITVGKTTKTIYAPNAPTLAGLMGNTAIGGTSSYIYWDGSKFTTKSLGALAFKESLSKSDVGLGNVENIALSTWAGSTNITTVGTITKGTWKGTKIDNAYLANSSVSIAGKSVSLGGSLSAADLKTALGITAADIGATKKYAGAITKGTALEYTITHNLGTRDVVVMVYDPSTYEQVMVDVVMTTTAAVKIAFGSAPSVNYRVVVVG